MKLYYSPTSPYVRKVSVAAIENGLDGRIEHIPTNILEPNDAFLAANPLSKVPALVTDDGDVLYDSPVICEYLDSLHPGVKVFPETPAARWTALRQQALGDGVMDAAVMCRLESWLRPEALRWQGWIDRHWAKVERGLDSLEAEAESMVASPLTIGHIAVGCALGFLDFRFADYAWRSRRPLLDAWYQTMMQRRSMASTVPVDASTDR